MQKEKIFKDLNLDYIINSIQELFCVYTTDLQIIIANKAAADSVGLKKEELPGKYCYNLWNNINQPCESCHVLKALETGEPQTVEKESTDGRFWRLYSYPIKNEFGEVVNLIELGLDITEKKKIDKKLKNREENLTALIENTNGLIWAIDPDYKLIIGNSKFNKKTEEWRKKPFLIGQKVIDQNLPKSVKKKWKEYYDRGLNGEKFSIIQESDFINPRIIQEFYFHPIHSNDGQINGVTVYGHDVTENMILKEKFEAISEYTVDMEWWLNQDGALIWVNTACKRFTGYSPNELKKIPYYTIVSKEQQKQFHENILDGLQNKSIINNKDYLIIKKNGKQLNVYVSWQPIYDKKEKWIGLRVSFRDIDNAKYLYEKVKKQESELKKTLEATTDGIWYWDFIKNQLYFSDKYYTMLGYDPQEFKPTYENWMNLLHPDDKDSALKVAQEYLKIKPNEYNNEFRLKTKNGDYRWIHTTGRIVERDSNGEAIRMIGNHQDITERKNAENRLLLLEENYRTIYNKSTDSMFIHDPETYKIIDVNHTTIEVLGYTKDEITKMNVGDLSINEPPYTQKEAVEWIQKSIKQGPQTFEWLAKKKNGELVWFENNVSVVKISGINRIIVNSRNITEKKKIHDELIKFSTIIKQSPSAIVITDLKGNILYVNPKFTELTGYYENEVIGKNPNILKSGQIKEKVYAELWATITSGKKWSGELINKKKNGDVYWEYASIAPVFNAEGNRAYFVKMAEDITIRKETGLSLKKSEEILRKKNADLKLAQKISLVGNWTLDPEVGVPEWSDIIYEIYERDPDKGPIPVKEYRKLYQGKDWKTFHNAISNASQKGIAYDIELQPKLPSGKEKWIRAICEPEKQSNNSCYLLRGTIQDITKAKIAEKKLRESKEKYSGVVDNIAVGVSVISKNMEILVLNNQMMEWFPQIDVKKKPLCYKHFKLKSEPCENCACIQTFQDGKVHEVIDQIATKKGMMDFKVVFSPVFDDNGLVRSVIKVVEDITVEQKYKRKILSINNTLRNILNSAEEIIISFDKNCCIEIWNKSAEIISGYTSKDIIGKSLEEIDIFEDSDSIKNILEKILNNKKPILNQVILKTKDNNRRVIDSSYSIIYDSGRSIKGILIIGKDVTFNDSSHGRVVRGNSYIITDDKSKIGLNIFNGFAKSECPCYFISRMQSEKIKNYTFSDNVIISLLDDDKSVTKYDCISTIEELIFKVDEFSKKNENSIIYLDRIDYLINKYSYNEFVIALYKINSIISTNNSLLLMRVNPLLFNSHQKAMLYEELNELPEQRVEHIQLKDNLFSLLDFIYGNNNENKLVNYRAISKHFSIVNYTVANRLNQLEKLGLISVNKEGRMKSVSVTEKGIQMLTNKKIV